MIFWHMNTHVRLKYSHTHTVYVSFKIGWTKKNHGYWWLFPCPQPNRVTWIHLGEVAGGSSSGLSDSDEWKFPAVGEAGDEWPGLFKGIIHTVEPYNFNVVLIYIYTHTHTYVYIYTYIYIPIYIYLYIYVYIIPYIYISLFHITYIRFY